MTSFDNFSVTCALCEHTCEVGSLTSTNSFGSPDLDSRPAGMARGTLPFQLMFCEDCGYCAYDLAQAPEGVAEIVHSPAYQAQLGDSGLPSLADQFLCRALITANEQHYAIAGWDALRAAWVCDDEQPAAASRCRELALQYWRQAQQAGQVILDSDDNKSPNEYQHLLLADVQRRSGQLEQARTECEQALERKLVKKLRLLLQYELVLIAAQDTACHTIDEAG